MQIQNHVRSFQQLPFYMRGLRQFDPDATLVLDFREDASTHEKSCRQSFIAPSSTTKNWSDHRPVVAVDALPSRGIHEYVLFIACGYDVDGQVITIAWGHASIETEETWAWFLRSACSFAQTQYGYPRSPECGCLTRGTHHARRGRSLVKVCMLLQSASTVPPALCPCSGREHEIGVR